MKKLLLYLTLVVVTISLFACKEDDNTSADAPHEYGFPSFIDYFYTPTAVNVRLAKLDKNYDAYPYIVMDCGYKEKTFAFNAKDETAKDMFVKYAKAYGDTVFSVGLHRYEFYASVMPLVSIDIITDKQFDEQHPAGSNVNDLVRFYMHWDHKRLIDNYASTQKFDQHEHYELDLDQVPQNPINMLNDWFRLHFTKNPDVLGKYNFTISIKFGADPVTDETVVFEPATVELEFE